MAFCSSGDRKATLPADKHIHGPGIRLGAGGGVAANGWPGRETSGIRAAHEGFAAAVPCAATVTGK
jgi:hypothetical protein